MRDFILFSNSGRTKGDWKDLMSAGRMDIICHAVIASLYLSNGIRPNVKLHVVLNGPPDPPKHLEFFYHPDSPLSKKDIGKLIRSSLWKCKKGKKTEAFPGVNIEKKGLKKLLDEFKDRNIYLLDERGKSLEEIEIGENPVFVLGDHEGLPKTEKKIAKKYAKETIRIGPLPYFASQTIVIANNYMDRCIVK